MKKFSVFSPPLSTSLLVLVLRTSAEPAFQFTADGFIATSDSAIWNAGDGSTAMTSVHTPTNGWSLATKAGDTIFFDNGVSSPLGFSDSATNRISYAFAVVECAEAIDHATLIDAPCSIRFMPKPFDDNATFFYKNQITNAVALSMNAVPTNGFTAAVTLQLVEAAFDSTVPLNELYIGGAPATAAWAQSWSGGISELILLAEMPTEEQRNALRRYLALKHGLSVPTESDGGIVSTLAAMGIDTAGLFNSVFLVR